MITIYDATPQDGQPDTQWGFNDYVLNFPRDSQGHLAETCIANSNTHLTTCEPTHADTIDGIYNADGDPSSGLELHVMHASSNPEPALSEIEVRLPLRLEPQDRIIRYHVPNSSNTYLVLRRPIYTDRCLSDPSGGNNIWETSPNLPSAIALFSGNSNRNDYCADIRSQFRPRTSGQLRMMMPFHRTNNVELVGNDPEHPEEGSLLSTLRTIRAEMDRPLNPNDERSVITHRVQAQEIDTLIAEVTRLVSRNIPKTEVHLQDVDTARSAVIFTFIGGLLGGSMHQGMQLMFGGHFFWQNPNTTPRYPGLFQKFMDWWQHRNDPKDPPDPPSLPPSSPVNRVPGYGQIVEAAERAAIGIGMGLATVAIGVGIALLLADDGTGAGTLDDALIPALARLAVSTAARSRAAFTAAGMALQTAHP